METINELFARRLQSARKRAGLSLQGLADRLTPTVSKQTIKHYEDGRTVPDSSKLLALGQALAVPIAYLFRPYRYELGPLSFRRKMSLTKTHLAKLEEDVRDQVERYLELEESLDAAVGFENPLAGIVISTEGDVERAADQLRQVWQLGLNPVPNVLELLEEHGVKVLEKDGPDGFDGLATYADGHRPLIVVNQHIGTERKRFTALHELGHLLLEFALDIPDKTQEKLCHRFAGAVLIAGDVLRRELGAPRRARIDLRELVSLKEYYGISVRALMKRACDLELITPAVFKNFCIQNSSNRTEEGWGQYEGREHSGRAVRLAHQAVAREVLSMSKAAELLGQPLDEFRDQMEMLGA